MNNITKQHLLDVRQLIQDDLLCLMDGLPNEAQIAACQIVVDRMEQLFDNIGN